MILCPILIKYSDHHRGDLVDIFWKDNMVSPELLKEVEERFDVLSQSSIEPGNYTGSLFDVAFEITTADTFVAGVASKIIDRDRLTKQDKAIVQRPLLLEGRWWQCDDGQQR